MMGYCYGGVQVCRLYQIEVFLSQRSFLSINFGFGGQQTLPPLDARHAAPKRRSREETKAENEENFTETLDLLEDSKANWWT